MPTVSNKELEDLLTAAGNSLLQPPSSVHGLLSLLDRIEELLSKVEQSPPKSMQNAISPLVKALVVEELLKHADVDVKVGVASCISEITRITAPDAPYDDDKMKDVFQLIVSSFANLWDTSSRSYAKRASMLETVAKVRSCVIMLDLECDQMIIEMFQNFLNAIRDHHADIIFSSMETIMNLVLEESEDIAPNLLSPILNNLKRNNEAVLPIAKKLAESVFQNSADKIRPYLAHAMKTIDASFDDYNEIVASVYRESTVADGRSHECIFKDQSVIERKSISASPLRPSATQATDNGNNDREETSTQDKNTTANRSPKSCVSNGVNESGMEVTLTDANYSKKEADSIDQFGLKSTAKTDSDDSAVQELARQENQVEHTPDRKDYSEKDLVEFADLDGEKQPEHVSDNQEIPDEDIHSSPVEISPTEAGKTLDKVEEANIQTLSSKAAENVVSPSISGELADESSLKKSGLAKRKEKLVREETVAVAVESKKASEAHVTEVVKQRHLGKKQSDTTVDKDTTLTEESESKNDGVDTRDSEERSFDEIMELEDADKKMQDVSLSSKENRKKSGRVKPRMEKDLKSSAREDHGRDTVTSPSSPLKSKEIEDDKEETPRKSNKRKRTPGTEKASETREYGENLVGSKVKVWWPKDRMFYEGVIASFDSATKKHKVLYTDGDKEVLNLRRERWEFVGDDSASDGGRVVEQSSHDVSSGTQRKRKGASNSKISSKLVMMEGSPRSKVKDIATRFGGKSKGENKVEPEAKDNNLKSTGKSDDDTGKFKDRTQKVGAKSHDDSAKASGRSKDNDASKYSSQSKQDSQRAAKSKGKNLQSSRPISSNGTGLTKSSLSRAKESDRVKEKMLDSTKSLQVTKGKSPDFAKSREKVKSPDIAKSREKGKSLDIAKPREKGKSPDIAKPRESQLKIGKKRRR